MPVFGVGKVYRIWTPEGGPPQFSTWMFVSSFLPFVVSLFLVNFWNSWGLPSVMSQPQKQGCHTLQRVDLACPFLVSPAIKIDIEKSLGMALSKAKSGSAWQSHFWQCGTLRAARNTKLFAWRKWIKVGFCLKQAFNATGEDHFLESKKPMCLRPRKWDCCSDPFCQNWRSFNKQQRFCKCRIPGNTVADWRFPAQSGAKGQVANLCQSTMLFGIVWVLLSQAFAAWRGWGADSAATLLVGCLFLRLPWQWIVLSRLGVALLSFVLVSWCVVCFWLPPFAPRLLTRQLCGSDCVSPGVQYHPIKE